jgi:hypothetical protein
VKESAKYDSDISPRYKAKLLIPINESKTTDAKNRTPKLRGYVLSHSMSHVPTLRLQIRRQYSRTIVPWKKPIAEELALIAGAVFATVTDDRTTTPSGIKNISLHSSYFFVRALKLSVWEE